MGMARREFIEMHLGPERLADYEVPPGPLAWLLDLLDDAGTCRIEIGGMGGRELLALGWREIRDWVEGAGEHSLSPTFRRALILLSAAHASTAMGAVELEYAAPFDPSKG